MSAEDYYYCPITQQLMVYPAIDKEGNTFEQAAITDWLLVNGTSPITQTPMTIDDLYLNKSLQNAIDIFRNSLKEKEDTSPQKAEKQKESLWGVGAMGGALAKGAMGVLMHMKVKACEARRNFVMQGFQTGLQQGWGPRQVEVMSFPISMSEKAVRVVAVRHGFGKHNEGMGIGSVANRDAELVPSIGVPQAYATGRKLKDAGFFKPLGLSSLLIVISPFRRTLQTALHLMGTDSWEYPTIITPLAAEHTFERSGVMVGDRGSTTTQLLEWFPSELHPQFDFSTVDRYCVEKEAAEGAWWRHGPGTHETESSFESRTRKLRKFVFEHARLRGMDTVLLISHGGLLTHAFDKAKYDNCEFRCFDLYEDGRFAFPTAPVAAEVAAPASIDGHIPERTFPAPSAPPLPDSVDWLIDFGDPPTSPPLDLTATTSPEPKGTHAAAREVTVTAASLRPPKQPHSLSPSSSSSSFPPSVMAAMPAGDRKPVVIEIEEVVQQVRPDRGHTYHIIGKLGNGTIINQRYRLSVLRGFRESIRQQVSKSTLDSLGEFPSTICPTYQVMRYLEPWLQKLCAMVNGNPRSGTASRSSSVGSLDGESSSGAIAVATATTVASVAAAITSPGGGAIKVTEMGRSSRRQDTAADQEKLILVVMSFFSTHPEFLTEWSN